MELHNAMFKISEVDGKGVGWIAKRDITKGEKIWEENAIIDNLGWSVQGRCLLSKIELDRKVNNLSAQKKDQFLSLNDPDKNGDPALRNSRIYGTNALSDGLYNVISRLNHSCQPNVIWSTNDDNPPYLQEVRALRDIPAGEEMTASYLRASKLRSRAERQEMLRNWAFICNCPVCSLTGADLEKNEKSRKIISESKEKISDFLDSLQSMVQGRDRFYSIKVKTMFKLATENLKLLETDLALDAGPVIVQVFQDLAVLSAFAQVFKLRIPDCERPETYKARAWQEAEKLGKMFMSNCEKTDAELECIKNISF
jgi:hypothetical protein